MALRFAYARSGQARVALFVIAALVAANATLEAHVKKIVIEKKTSPAFDGATFGPAGQYETLAGKAYGELDPKDPHNAIITDIGLAPRNPNGTVGYQHNFYILKPVDLSHGNHKMMYEPPNRGGKTYQTLNNTPTAAPLNGDDPATIVDPNVLADSFLWGRGYTTVWSGWENNLGPLSGFTATASP